MRIAILIVASILSLWSAGAQTTGQMRVEKPTSKEVIFTQCVIDTVVWRDTFYYVISTAYNPRTDVLCCYDSSMVNGNYLLYYETNNSKFPPRPGQLNTPNVVGMTYQLKDGKSYGKVTTYHPHGETHVIGYYDDSGHFRRQEIYFNGLVIQESFINIDGTYDKTIYYNRNGIKQQVVFYTKGADNFGNILNIITGALEYDTKGNIVYKYNCATQTRVTLNPDGSVKAIDENVSCDDLYKMK